MMVYTDWRPIACNKCGRLMAASRFPKCTNPLCTSNKTKTEKQYVLIQKGKPVGIYSDLSRVWIDRNFDPDRDEIRELGQRVRFKVVVETEND